MSAPPASHFINGRFQSAASDAQTFPIINPATEEVIANVPIASSTEVDQAVRAARVAFDSGVWSNLTGSQRAVYLRAIAAGVQQNAASLGMLETLNMGKPFMESAWDMDVRSADQFINE